jgi:hypothetical protein
MDLSKHRIEFLKVNKFSVLLKIKFEYFSEFSK